MTNDYKVPVMITAEAKTFLIEKIKEKNQSIQNKSKKCKYILLKVLNIGKNKFKYRLSFENTNKFDGKYIFLDDQYSIIVDKDSENHIENCDIFLKKTIFGNNLEILGYRKINLCDCTKTFSYIEPVINKNQLELFEYKEIDFKN